MVMQMGGMPQLLLLFTLPTAVWFMPCHGSFRSLLLRSQASTAEVRALHGLCKELERRQLQAQQQSEQQQPAQQQ